MGKVFFILDTSADAFAAWLLFTCRALGGGIFPTDSGTVQLQALHSGQRDGVRTLTAGAVWVSRVNEQGHQQAQDLGDVLEFQLLPLTKERVEIRAECRGAFPLLGYFADVLQAIDARWPELGETLEWYLDGWTVDIESQHVPLAAFDLLLRRLKDKAGQRAPIDPPPAITQTPPWAADATGVFVEQEIIFTGTPAQFLDLVDTYESRRQWYDRDTVLHRFKTYIMIWPPTSEDEGTIETHDLPGQRSLVICWARRNAWPSIKPYWQELLAELDRLGCIERQLDRRAPRGTEEAKRAARDDPPAGADGSETTPAVTPVLRAGASVASDAGANEPAARDDLPAPKYPYSLNARDEVKLRQLWADNSLSYDDLATEFKVTADRIKDYKRMYGLPDRKRGRKQVK